MSMDAFVDTLRCGMTGQIMEDPVIVYTELNPHLELGTTYERRALEQWLRERGDDKTRYGPNTVLKRLIDGYRQGVVIGH
jgi:hypothetical protein